jgi:hypothetical protein
MSFDLGRHLASRRRTPFEVERQLARRLAVDLRSGRHGMMSKLRPLKASTTSDVFKA